MYSVFNYNILTHDFPKIEYFLKIESMEKMIKYMILLWVGFNKS
jgi:hypothetical protein